VDCNSQWMPHLSMPCFCKLFTYPMHCNAGRVWSQAIPPELGGVHLAAMGLLQPLQTPMDLQKSSQAGATCGLMGGVGHDGSSQGSGVKPADGTGSTAFLSITFHPRHVSGPQMEAVVWAVVTLPTLISHQTKACKVNSINCRCSGPRVS
jgi:hypothetical protein